MITLLLKLLIAHVVGDFVLQPTHWVAAKKEKTYKSKYFYLHGLVHLLALIVILGFDASYWLSILAIVISHLGIDLLKLRLEGKFNHSWLFAADQCLHLLVIFLVVYANTSYTIDFSTLYAPKFLLLILALLTVSFVSSILMKILMSKWVLEEDKSEDSLENAGKYIGILERLFVFGFILLNQWSAIGLLIAAKSVFRFGDLSRAKDRKLTEYILIGTLISFGLAISIGLAYQYISKLI
ncbi:MULTISPECIES: DUF3307 domain-containing protein [unclassified Tenacibaculum]|uniref:DUF3307 domain-containing protein n=1 Tax=unclassified Tenacibaculum TaxID=2635139 RepID=UPI001F262C44|nr:MULTISPECIES: DUF3307 domain-containing protein [unclassified Tenacibaculum]MCF2874304.1 DUF3307 domain-containing protein [Tenacibaculum sp. Cn5-1]MCF2934885.1 DUF3307 domain-containing protein [Tenacibaculum sp. Cn5-34]MCG7511095.1 DUF3307 domain-containing protein [Tenacibaculum sp. Cn5-46]